MTTSPVPAFQLAQGRTAAARSGKDDGEALPGFGDMLRDAPSVKGSGKPATDAGSRWVRFAEKLDRTVPIAGDVAMDDAPDEVAAKNPDETGRPVVFRKNPPDASMDASVVLAQPPLVLPFAQTETRSAAAPAHASGRNALESSDFPDAAGSREPLVADSEPDATEPRMTFARSNPSPEPSSNRIFSPDAFSAPAFPGVADARAPVKEAKDSGAGVSEGPPATSTPPVNVLSRQDFPAPVQTTVASLTQSLASDETFARAMSKTHPTSLSNGALAAPAHTLKIELHPAELGTVTASLRMAGEQLSIELKVETAEAHRRLSGDSEAIVTGLRGLGYDIDKVTIVQPAGAATRQETATSGTGGGQRGGEQLGSGTGGERSAGQQRGGGRDGEGKAHAAASGQRAGSGVFI